MGFSFCCSLGLISSTSFIFLLPKTLPIQSAIGRYTPSSGLQEATQGCGGAFRRSISTKNSSVKTLFLVWIHHLEPWLTIIYYQQRANILKEVQIMRQIDHPNIVKLVDFSESRQYYYIVLELCPGGELFHQIVRLTYFSEDLSRHVILQVAQALEYLHEDAGVVHRSVHLRLIGQHC